MPTISLTSKAESDLDSIHDYYVSKRGVQWADRVVLEILEMLDVLGIFPGAGRQSPVPDVRELVLVKYPYTAPYRVVGDEVQIIRLLHQRSEPVEANDLDY